MPHMHCPIQQCHHTQSTYIKHLKGCIGGEGTSILPVGL